MTANIDIAVQPPPIAGVNLPLNPPLVAKTQDQALMQAFQNGSKHVSAFAVLYSPGMEDHGYAQRGNWTVSAQLVHSSSSGDWLYFVFNQLSVAVEGTYVWNVAVTVMGAGVSNTVGGTFSREFTVQAQAPPSNEPSKSCLFCC